MINSHTVAACSLIQTMLSSKTDHHIAVLCQLAQGLNRQEWMYFDGKPGFGAYLNFHVAVVSEILEQKGSVTVLSLSG